MVKIVDVNSCDEAYGTTLVQYESDGVVGYEFTDVPEEKIEKYIGQEIDVPVKELVLWSDLSEILLDIITTNCFDMHFVEKDDEEWTEELADKVYEEVCKFGLKTITRGEDDAYLTVYAGTMCEINWFGHRFFGK